MSSVTCWMATSWSALCGLQLTALSLQGNELAAEVQLLATGEVVWNGVGHGLFGPLAALPLDGLEALIDPVDGFGVAGGVVS
jgi:hypothetical protein